MIGLPGAVTTCLFDLDGVLTSTAAVHLRAWRQTFDEVLRATAPEQRAFSDHDYITYVDGRSRLDGVRGFLGSRGIDVPEGTPDDPVDAPTVHGIGNRKNERLLHVISTEGVSPYPGSVRYLDAIRAQGLAIGVVTSSANGERVLDAAGLTEYVRARVDGRTLEAEGLRGKPAPDSFVACAHALGAAPGECAVFEDALAGVEAGRAGGFAYVVGVNRVAARASDSDRRDSGSHGGDQRDGDQHGGGESGEDEPHAETAAAHAEQAEALRARGADVVVDDLADLLADEPARRGGA